MVVRIKRVYDEISATDGCRVLVDRLWPRGLSKEAAKINLWLKNIAPSNELRKWYEHDPAKWGEFKEKYYVELEGHSVEVQQLIDEVSRYDVTLVFSSRSPLNNAVALKEYLDGRVAGSK